MSFFFFSINNENALEFDENNNTLLTGEVISVGDGIIHVLGLENIESGAVVESSYSFALTVINFDIFFYFLLLYFLFCSFFSFFFFF
jgi:F0F1-type ATP synthase alpha subunit